MRLFRLFRLLDHLRLRTRPVAARELARLTGVSLRTVYRDIADLQAMGAPIRGEGGVGYVMARGFFVPSLSFDPDELEALALGTRLVAARSTDTLSEAAKRASAKIASAIGEEAREGFVAAPLEAGSSAASLGPEVGRLHDALRAAIRGRAMLEIDYVSLEGVASSRVARPLGLTVFDSAWLLTIWCERAQDFRHLRVDRIASARPTGASFVHQRGRRFADFLAREGHGDWVGRRRVEGAGPGADAQASTRRPSASK